MIHNPVTSWPVDLTQRNPVAANDSVSKCVPRVSIALDSFRGHLLVPRKW